MNKTKIALGLEQGDPPLWREIVHEIVSISEYPELTKPNREFLFTLINFEGRLIVDHSEIHDGPHCMSPEDMSKSLALQTLAKFGDNYSVNIFEVLKIKFENHSTLRSIAKACAEQVKKDKFVSKISKQLEEEFDFNDPPGPATEREAKHQRKDINKFYEDLKKFYEVHRD